MPTKQTILDNVGNYTPPQLVEYIRSGVVTYEELCNENDFSYTARSEVERLLEQQPVAPKPEPEPASPAEDSASGEDADGEEDLFSFDLDEFKSQVKSVYDNPPMGISSDQAVFNIVTQELGNGNLSKQDLLDIIKRDNNFLRGTTLHLLKKASKITTDDLKDECGIEEGFIKLMAKDTKRGDFDPPSRPLGRISMVCTEVYFWGVPSSGKTCALGAIMSVANNGIVAKTMSKNPVCQGYDYMNRLSEQFQTGKIQVLPGKTPTDSIYEMGLELTDEKNKVHPITCIDLAGEVMEAMYLKNANLPLSVSQATSLQTATNLLVDKATNNRKIHFFVIEYGGENRSFKGLRQKIYLDGAVEYLKKTNIFKKDTDAIYLIVTKTDMTGRTGTDLQEALREYVYRHYKNFYNGLNGICRINGINGGKVVCMPFSVGKVCFKVYCKFDDRAAANVVRELLTRCKGFKTGKYQDILNRFKR